MGACAISLFLLLVGDENNVHGNSFYGNYMCRRSLPGLADGVRNPLRSLQ
jgi:hypothetical protein